MIESLDVVLWGKKVGTLVAMREAYRNKAYFYFDKDYARSGYDIAPLKAPITGVVALRGLPVYPEEDKLCGGLPSFVADSLPDHWGNTLFNEWAKAHNIHEKELSALDRLAYIGRRGMGAFEFVPPIAEEMEKPFKVEISNLYDLARQALENATKIHTNLLIESLFKVGTSAGGRRPKAVVNVNLKNGDCYSGQVAAPSKGYTPMIVKFDEHLKMPITRIEYSYYLMAKGAGLDMMESRLFETATGTHFLTERFDRKGDKKIHIQTLAALNPLSKSYEDLFDVAYRIGIAPTEMRQLFLSMVMNVFGGNVDDHNKNFSFLMEEDGVWHIAPTYDYTFAIDPEAPHYVNRHSLSINGKLENITAEDLIQIARQYSVKSPESIINKVVEATLHYSDYAKQAGVSSQWIKTIENEIAARSYISSKVRQAVLI